MRNSIVVYRDADKIGTLTYTSANRKTGDMAQLQILARHESPTAAIESGTDSVVCGDCPLRKTNGKRVCYVNVAHAPLAVWKAVRRAPVTSAVKAKARLARKGIRLGAYGDPAFLPLPLLETLTDGRVSTGYTHQWTTADRRYSRHLMASVETLEQRTQAKAKGYRTFRVVADLSAIADGEILCPNYTQGINCADCGLCNGAGKAKDIVILAHGNGAAHLNQIEGA